MRPTKYFFGIFYVVLSVISPPSVAESRNYSINAFQLHGAMRIDEEWRFSIRNKATESSFWLKMGSSYHGLTALKYRPNPGVLTLDYKGSQYNLKMAAPEEKPIRVLRSATSSVVPKETDKSKIPPVPQKAPPQPPNKGLPPKLPPPSKIPKRIVSSVPE